MAEMRPQRIDNITAGLMIAVAVVLDLISLIPFVNLISGLAATLIFGLWFFFRGVGFVNPRRIATWAAGLIVEAIPFLSILPGLTIAVTATIVMIKLEDKK